MTVSALGEDPAGIWWVEARMLMNIMHNTTPHPIRKNYLAQSINKAEVDKSFTRLIKLL